jgi:hypothetical protein
LKSHRSREIELVSKFSVLHCGADIALTRFSIRALAATRELALHAVAQLSTMSLTAVHPTQIKHKVDPECSFLRFAHNIRNSSFAA